MVDNPIFPFPQCCCRLAVVVVRRRHHYYSPTPAIAPWQWVRVGERSAWLGWHTWGLPWYNIGTLTHPTSPARPSRLEGTWRPLPHYGCYWHASRHRLDKSTIAFPNWHRHVRGRERSTRHSRLVQPCRDFASLVDKLGATFHNAVVVH